MCLAENTFPSQVSQLQKWSNMHTRNFKAHLIYIVSSRQARVTVRHKPYIKKC